MQEAALYLDHGNIVGTVTDGKGDGMLVFLDQGDDKSLLQGWHTTADHSL